MPVSIEDRTAIHDLYSRYNFNVDILGDAQGTADLFVEEGEYHHGKFGSYFGNADIAAFMQTAIDEQRGCFQHWNGNILIEVDGAHAEVSAYIMTLDARGATPVIARVSVYQDRLVRLPKIGWRFISRRVGYPNSELRVPTSAE